MTPSPSRPNPTGKKVANRLVAASCAAVLAVYVAGYSRTQSAANRLAAQVAERRAAVRDPERVISSVTGFRPRAPRVPEGALVPVPSAPRPQHEKSREARIEIVAPASADLPRAVNELKPVEAPASAPATPVEQVDAAPTPPVLEHKAEAAVGAPAVVLPSAPAPAWKDGAYTGWGYSRHGNIEAAVVIEGGRIASATISQCRTRYSCSVIDKLIPQVAQRQSPDVDYVSGATQSADAFYGAVVEALSKAK